MQDTFVFAAKGCPSASGELRCENVEFPLFGKLAAHIDAKTDGLEDIFADEQADSREESQATPPMCDCDEDH